MKTTLINTKTIVTLPIIGLMLILSAMNVKASTLPSCQNLESTKQIDLCIKDLRAAKKSLQKAEKLTSKNIKQRKLLEAKLAKLQEKLKNL